MAVEIFFVISGFYMQMVLSERYTSAGAFYFSRGLRIFPTYWVVAAFAFALWPSNVLENIIGLGWQPAVLVFASSILIVFQDVLLFLGVAQGELFFTANFHSSAPELHSYVVLRPAWTMALELYFYLLAPLLARSSSVRLIVAGLMLTGARLVAYDAGLDYDPWQYRFFPFELPLFLLGMLGFRVLCRIDTFAIVRSKAVALVGLALLILLGQCFALQVSARYNFVAAATAVAVVPVAFAAFKDVSVDRFLGDLSYPIYLVHFPVAQFLSHRYAVVVALSLVISCLIVVGLERPLDRLRRRLTSTKNEDRADPPIAAGTRIATAAMGEVNCASASASMGFPVVKFDQGAQTSERLGDSSSALAVSAESRDLQS